MLAAKTESSAANKQPQPLQQRGKQPVTGLSLPAVPVLQTKKAAGTDTSLPVQRKPNKTGLPDNLKAGVEQLSGFAMDDVKVHYNSAKPVQLQALAYAQGTQIHIAPDQEKHLPHEAWHVAQQKQGRVKPTLQMKGVAVNDDSGLEREADVMGQKAAANSVSFDSPSAGLSHNRNDNNLVQRYPIVKNGPKSVVAAHGRPDAKSNKSTIEAIVALIYINGPTNDLETKLFNMNDQHLAVWEITDNTWLSSNGAAICHKHAISEFEAQFVEYTNIVLSGGNNAAHESYAIDTVKSLTCLDNAKQGVCLLLLGEITNNSKSNKDPAGHAATHLTKLILELDGSFSNLYIGFSRSNSSIGHHFDPHYNVYSAADPPASPVSARIYGAQRDFGDHMGMGHSSPRREDDGIDKWNQTSSLPDKGSIAYDHHSNSNL